MEAIRVENLSVSYEDKLVIEHMNIAIPVGGVSIIIGANGCGKSTLLKAIARVIKPSEGNIFIKGRNIREEKERILASQIAFLPQGPVCPAGLSVKELITFGRFPHRKMIGGLNGHDRDIIQWAMEETELEDYADREIGSLSGGQRQRAWIALAQETDIIMLDEPTTYLDMSYQLEVLKVLEKLNKNKNITILIVLHELNNACRFASNIIGLKKGKLIFQGAPIEVITQENLKNIYGIHAKLQLSENRKYPICVEYE